LRRFLFISSSAVYGDSGGLWVDEYTPIDPGGFNGRILARAEQWLAGRLPAAAVVLRLAGLYGPGRVELLKRLRDGRAPVPATGARWINRIHIDDAARAAAHLLYLDAPRPCYLGVDNRPYRMDELYDALAAMLDAPAPRRTGAAPAGRRLCNARLRNSGFEPAWPDALQGYRPLAAALRPRP